MKLLIGILVGFIITFFYLYIRERSNQLAMKKLYEEQDVMLAKYIAQNLDMEKQINEMRYEYEKQKELAKEVQKVQKQIRTLKHDMKNHTMVILGYLEEGKAEKAKEYAGEILNKLNKMYTYVNVGNSLLNYILNNKLSKAKESGCEIKAEIENLSFSYMESVDFSALLNNLLDNAMEGALSSQNKKVEIQIVTQKGFDVITIKNSIDDSVLEKNVELRTTKTEPGHGFGIKQIKDIVEKYNGMIDIHEKENMFVVSILLGECCLSL